MRLASLRSLNTRLRSYLHTHTHTRKPYTLCPLWARVHFPAELRHSTPQGTRDARFPTPTEYHWYSPFIETTSILWHAQLVPNYGAITPSTLTILLVLQYDALTLNQTCMHGMTMKITTHMKRQEYGCHYTTYKYKTSQLAYKYTDV